ncbi:MAG: hypothetical protein ACE5FF_18590 [Saprospiraceae bacterium]
MEVLNNDFKNLTLEDEPAVRKLRIETVDVLKTIKQARIALIVLIFIAAFAVVTGVYTLGMGLASGWVAISGRVFFVCLFAWSAWYISKNPRTGLIAGTSVYIIQQLLFLLAMPNSFTVIGGLTRVIIIVFLARGIKAAFDYEKLNEKMRSYGEEIKI